jgi:hypothetical protein
MNPMKPTFQLLFAVIVIFISIANAWSQDGNKYKVNYSKHPHWIQMMDDPNVNYHEAVKAFNAFWKDRGEPEEEEAEGERKEKRSFLKRIFKSEEKEKAENSQYFIHYRRFKQWQRDVEPFVQADGTILSKEEQAQIWKDSRK